MPGIISVNDFIRETLEDHTSPTTSNFPNRLHQIRDSVLRLEETLSQDKDGLTKFRNCIKDMNKSGNGHVTNENELSKALNKLGESALLLREEDSDDIGAAFQKFSVVFKELANLMNNLMRNLDSSVLTPAEQLMKIEFRGSKGDLKRPFDRAWKDYQDKYSELERQKKKAAKDAGLHRSDLTAGEIADEMDKERKFLQLTMAEYLIRINEIKTKKGAFLLQQLLEYYRAQYNYFNEGLQTIEHFGSYIEDLTNKLSGIRQEQEDEKQKLINLRNTLKTSPGFSKNSCVTPSSVSNTSYAPYTLHQAKGDASLGNRKTGYLYKRSEGRFRAAWQKRKCNVTEGFLDIYHADESKDPTRVNLLTCQMKTIQEERLHFDVVSYNRTYHFQAESDIEKEEWMSVLLNSKDGALNQAFEDNGKSSCSNEGFMELQRTLVNCIRRLPGNDKCCDCGSTNDATWISTNFGIIVCIECSGIHREMGVHISKIQSLTLDHIGTAQLLVARVMSNEQFNKVMEATALVKLNPLSSMDERKSYIKHKYVDRKFIQSYCSSSQEIFLEMEAAINSHNIYDLLQVISEASIFGIEFTDPLPSSEFGETSLHYAISHETGSSLHIVDFMIQNSLGLDKQTREGNAALHYCVIQNQTESLRLLLRSGANPAIENNNGKTPLSIAKERGHVLCEEMLQHALLHKKKMFENVNIDWRVCLDDGSTDFSDDETLDDNNRSGTPERKNESPLKRPLSMYTSGVSPSKIVEWTSLDSGDSPGSIKMPPPPPPSYPKKTSIFSGSNLAAHMVGSLKKGSSKGGNRGAFSTLPINHKSSPRIFSSCASSISSVSHKRSPSSSDSGNGTFINNQMSRSNTPISIHSSLSRNKLHHHTVFLHVESKSESDGASPPLQSFTEESSPENNCLGSKQLRHSRRTQSTESLDSLSDESGGNDGTSRNPVPPPRKCFDFTKTRKCRALYDCEADNEDELSFEEGDIIAIINDETEDENWMEGVSMSDTSKRGLFPVSFVHMLS